MTHPQASFGRFWGKRTIRPRPDGIVDYDTSLPDWRDHKVAVGDAEKPDRVRNVCRTWKQVQRLLHGGDGPGAERIFAGGHYRGLVSAETCIVRSVATLTVRCSEERAGVIAARAVWGGILDYLAFTLGSGDGECRMGFAVRLPLDYLPRDYVGLVTSMAHKLESSPGLAVNPASLCPGHRLLLPPSALALRRAVGSADAR